MARSIRSTPALPDDRAPLSAAQITSWKEQGFALVSALLPETLIRQVREAALQRFPVAGSQDAERYTNFGSNIVFPSSLDGFNDLTLHPRLLAATGQLLGCTTTDLRLTQSDLWPKYGREERPGGPHDNQDQRVHVDYPNHMLTHPTPWHRPAAVEMIVYFDHHEEVGGGTAVVPREGHGDPAYPWPIIDTPGVAELDYVNDRPSAERYLRSVRPEAARWRETLYQREVLSAFAPGDVLLYRHDTWHRGTPLEPGTLRLAHNLTYRHADAEWIATLHKGWSWNAYRKDRLIERLIATATVAQRTVLGFPRPGSAYWDAATLAAVTARYEPLGFDPRPYAEALTPQGG